MTERYKITLKLADTASYGTPGPPKVCGANRGGTINFVIDFVIGSLINFVIN